MRKSKKGFTLIELIIVVAVLSILAAIAIPNFISLMTKARTSVEVAATAELVNAINIHNAQAKAGSGTLIMPTALSDIDALKTQLGTLNPVIDSTIDMDHVTARITISDDGLAYVSDKGDL